MSRLQSQPLEKLPLIDLPIFSYTGINKTTGINHLSDKVLRPALSNIASLFCDIINRAISESHFSSLWEIAVVTSLHKGGDREEMSVIQ